MTKTSVVILNYNGEKLLRQFLPSVIEHTQHADIIVADNGSTDNSVKIVTDEFPTIRLIRLDKNYGFCGGYNRALKEVKTDYYLLLNSDIEVTQGWLIHLENLLDRDKTIVAVQPKILSYHRKSKFEHAGAAGGFVDTLGYPYCRGRILNHVETDEGQYDDEQQIYWASGACMLIRARTFHEFGGFDEDFFAHMEEIDLCWKINRTNNKIYYTGKSTVYHVGAGTLGYESPRKTFLNFRNGLTLIFKHFDTDELYIKLPLRIILDWIAAVVFLASGQLQNAKAVFGAHASFISNLKNNTRKRNTIRTAYPNYSRKGIYKGLIIADYYLFGKRRISNPR
jgi:GT2 family glycosyltransferase